MRLYVLGLLTVLLLVNEPNSVNGICNITKNNTKAECHYIDDIKNIKIKNKLEKLKIYNIDKYIPFDSFNNLKNLQHLDLSNGKLRELETGLFLNLRELQSLDLSNNNLHKILNGTFDGLFNLKYLNLHDNYLDTIPIDINNIKNLKYINLNNNKLICNCNTLKQRDNIILRGINITNKLYCYGPNNLKGLTIYEPNSENICLFEKQEEEYLMQKDEPVTDTNESSGEINNDDLSDKIADMIIPDEKIYETTTEIPVKLNVTDVTSQNDSMGFSDNLDIKKSTLSLLTVTELIENNNNKKINNEGSGIIEDDIDNGSGIEGSGIDTSIVPPIDWSSVSETTSDTPDNNSLKPTQSSSWSWSIFDLFGTSTSNDTLKNSTESTTKSAVIDDINLAQDDFLPVTTTTTTSTPTTTKKSSEVIKNSVLLNIDNNENLKTRIIDNNEKTIEIIDDNNELPDASLAIQIKKSYGSYIVLGGLLIVLALLISLAAYRGDFCNNKNNNSNNNNNNNKRNIRNHEFNDIENGTELKDLTKSLIDDNNKKTIQPIINNKNGNKHETLPLVNNNDNDNLNTNNKDINEPIAKYIGNVSEQNTDPIKPPRKSYSPNEHDNDTNNYVNEQLLKQKNDKDLLVNGKHERDSLSSGKLSNQFNEQSSPGAQRVKITLQDNPDSIPKTPLLITKIIGGENLVKTSP